MHSNLPRFRYHVLKSIPVFDLYDFCKDMEWECARHWNPQRSIMVYNPHGVWYKKRKKIFFKTEEHLLIFKLKML